MRILLMTDLEGVAGIKNYEDWCRPDSMFYEKACRLLTEEINAAVDGFLSAGADYVEVADGHGPGAVDVELLDPRAEYARGWPKAWPFGLDEGFEGVAWVGQHAKASSEFAHLCHTQSFGYIDLSVNGISIGEFGQLALCASELGVPAFFASGDRALTEEAQELVPGIVTCEVKRGVTAGTGEDCTREEYQRRNAGAIHTPPVRARQVIREAAEAALRKLEATPPALIPLVPPFHRIAVFRPDEKQPRKTVSRESDPHSVIEVMRMPFDPQPTDQAPLVKAD